MNGTRRLLVTGIGAAALVSIAVAPASAIVERIVTELRPLPFTAAAAVRDINGSGVAVGWSYTLSRVPSRPVRWEASDKVTELPNLPGHLSGEATGISENGTIVGFSDMVIPVRWAPDGTITELPMPPDETKCRPEAVNDAGDIVGVCYGNDYSYKWAANGQITRLTPLAGGFRAIVQDISADGTVVGWTDVDTDLRYPTKWLPNGTAVRLSGLPGQAYGINDKGQVAGEIVIADGLPHTKHYAVRWEASGQMVNLGGAPGSAKPHGSAQDINEEGTVVGFVVTDEERYLGARWSKDNVFTALNSLPSSTVPPATGAWAISDNNQIVGYSAGYPSSKSVRWSGYR